MIYMLLGVALAVVKVVAKPLLLLQKKFVLVLTVRLLHHQGFTPVHLPNFALKPRIPQKPKENLRKT